MAYTKTQWQDHSVEFNDRYNIVQNGDDTVTITKKPGNIVQQGTPVNADNLNKIEAGIYDNAQLILGINGEISAEKARLDGALQRIGQAESKNEEQTGSINQINTNIVAVNGRIDNITPRFYTAQITGNWAGSAVPFTQVISIVGIKATDNLIVDMVASLDYTTAQNEIKAYSSIYKIESLSNSIKVYTQTKTAQVINIKLEVK